MSGVVHVRVGKELRARVQGVAAVVELRAAAWCRACVRRWRAGDLEGRPDPDPKLLSAAGKGSVPWRLPGVELSGAELRRVLAMGVELAEERNAQMYERKLAVGVDYLDEGAALPVGFVSESDAERVARLLRDGPHTGPAREEVACDG